MDAAASTEAQWLACDLANLLPELSMVVLASWRRQRGDGAGSSLCQPLVPKGRC